MRAWALTDVLVLDDFAIQPLADQAAADLLEVLEDRASLRSTIVTSQLPIALWHENLGEATIADAILDRLLAGSHRIELRGDSMRRAEPSRAGERLVDRHRAGRWPLNPWHTTPKHKLEGGEDQGMN
jgi:DNA replication protein DnaC